MKYSEVLGQLHETYKPINMIAMGESLQSLIARDNHKIVVLDDDPTGIQTVHGVTVYTSWEKSTIEKGFRSEDKLFFVLTNSRGLGAETTEKLHREIGKTISQVSRETNTPFILMSRGDSTLRGHYPLETETLRLAIEAETKTVFHGEIICPFFLEGGRVTIVDTHYIVEDDIMMKAGDSEFAKDKTFGYHSSHLGEWVEEKTGKSFSKGDLIYIGLDILRCGDVAAVKNLLASAQGFNKIIINAVEEQDLIVAACGIYEAIGVGKRFIFRTAAALVKVMGGISSRPLLSKAELVGNKKHPIGLIVAGSHTKKTTAQLAALKGLENIQFIEFNQHLVMESQQIFQQEIESCASRCSSAMAKGKTVCLSTRRERFDINTGSGADELNIAMKISDAVVEIVEKIDIAPDFVIAKGGITSSEIGTKALGVTEAIVLGQAEPGVPVWRCGIDSRFQGLSYVIFPGNVGSKNSLRNIVSRLLEQHWCNKKELNLDCEPTSNET